MGISIPIFILSCTLFSLLPLVLSCLVLVVYLSSLLSSYIVFFSLISHFILTSIFHLLCLISISSNLINYTLSCPSNSFGSSSKFSDCVQRFTFNTEGLICSPKSHFHSPGYSSELTHLLLLPIQPKVQIQPQGGALEWATDHGSTFELNKSAHLIWTKQHTLEGKHLVPLTRPLLELQGWAIPTVHSQQVLGVILDQELRFKEQSARAVLNSTKWVQAVQHLAQSTKDIPAKFMRHFFISVAIPRMLYGVSIYLHPNTKGECKSKGVQMMAHVQCQAALLITGAMSTTAGELLDAHANLFPLKIAINKQLHWETVQMAALPSSHPLHTELHQAARQLVKSHPALLLFLFHHFQVEPSLIETIPAV
jgi:hypothetical protein